MLPTASLRKRGGAERDDVESPLTDYVLGPRDAAYKNAPAAKARQRRVITMAILFIGWLAALLVLFSWWTGRDNGRKCPDGVARVNTLSFVHMREVDRAQSALANELARRENADEACAPCPVADVCLRCIVWRGEVVWFNPAIVAREGEVIGNELPFGERNASLAVRKKRAKSVTVEYNNGERATVNGTEAFCIQYAVDMFESL